MKRKIVNTPREQVENRNIIYLIKVAIERSLVYNKINNNYYYTKRNKYQKQQKNIHF